MGRAGGTGVSPVLLPKTGETPVDAGPTRGRRIVEILVEILAVLFQIFAEACCEGIVVVGVDALFGVSAYKSRQASVRARTGGRAAAADPWVWTFWLLLPVAVGLTALFVWSLLAPR